MTLLLLKLLYKYIQYETRTRNDIKNVYQIQQKWHKLLEIVASRMNTTIKDKTKNILEYKKL